MFYRGRELRQLFEMEVYEDVEKKNDENPVTYTETVVAWNAVDAIRRSGGKAATYPEHKGFVTWPEADGKVYIINSPLEGPSGDPINPTIPIPTEEDTWDF